MMINKIAVCPICGKRTCLRIQNGAYLSEYPIRVNCKNCRALIKGVYLMPRGEMYGILHLLNAQVEECEFDSSASSVTNADYLAEISGELPCDIVTENLGPIPVSPFLRATNNLTSTNTKERLTIKSQ